MIYYVKNSLPIMKVFQSKSKKTGESQITVCSSFDENAESSIVWELS